MTGVDGGSARHQRRRGRLVDQGNDTVNPVGRGRPRGPAAWNTNSFLTLSAAYTHWPDIFSLLDPENIFFRMQAHIASCTRQQFVNENPHIVAKSSQERAEFFVKRILTEKLEVKDQRARYKWHYSGWGHIPFFVWLDGAPDASNMGHKSPEETDRIRLYFDGLISAWNVFLRSCTCNRSSFSKANAWYTYWKAGTGLSRAS